VEGYYNSNSSSSTPKQAFQLKTKAESSKTVIILVMTIGKNNWEDEMAAMKAMLEKIVKESIRNEVHFKLHEEKIARLMRNLEK